MVHAEITTATKTPLTEREPNGPQGLGAGMCICIKFGMELSCHIKKGEVEDISTVFILPLPLSSSIYSSKKRKSGKYLILL